VNAVAGCREHAVRVQVHTAGYGGLSRAILVLAVGILVISVPTATVGLVLAGAAQALVLLPGLFGVFWLLGYFTLRDRPLIYAGLAGLDFEWAWGKQQHIVWADICQIKQSPLRQSLVGHCFRLSLTRGSLDFYARRDFPEIVRYFSAAQALRSDRAVTGPPLK
jgi:hypothetical protein